MTTTEPMRQRLGQAVVPLLFGERQVAVQDVQQISDGWETDVWAFTAGGRQLVIRIYAGPTAAQVAAKEHGVLQRLFAAGYPVPEVYALATEPGPLSGPFIVMERITGRVLGSQLQTAAAAPPPAALAGFVELLVRLHRLDWHGVLPQPLPYADTDPTAPARFWVEQAGQSVARADVTWAGPALEWLQQRAQSVQTTRLAVVHNDFHFNNILVRDDGTCVVIDWSGVEVGDPRQDLAWAMMLTELYVGEVWAEELLRQYEAQTGAAVHDLDYFRAAALARRLFSILVSIANGAEALGMRPGLEVMLRQQVALIRKVYAGWVAGTGVALPEAEQLVRELG